MAVTFLSLEGVSVILEFPRQATLKAMQKQLCSVFGKNYPYTAAYLCVGAKAYSDFESIPLLEATDHETANVTFVRQVSDPSGYVEVSRKRSNKITLREECAWEDLVAKGETDLDLEELGRYMCVGFDPGRAVPICRPGTRPRKLERPERERSRRKCIPLEEWVFSARRHGK